MEKILTVFAALFLASLCLAEPSKVDLDALQSKAKEKEQEVQKYREEEQKISKKLSAIEQQQAAAQQAINKIESDMSQVEQNKITTANKKSALERSLPVWEDALDKDAVIFLTGAMTDTPYYDSGSQLTNILLNRAVEHKSLFSAAIQKENTLAGEKIESFEQKNRALQEQTTEAERQSALIKKDFQRVKTDLSATHKKQEAAQAELDNIKKSAEEMRGILSAVETKRKKAAEKEARANGSSGKTQSIAEIDARPHSLPHPVGGEIISGFGKEYNSDLNITIFRDGVKIAADPGETVYSVDEGTVIYSGNFRSYGNVVIIDHGKGFFTIYGYLRRIDVKKGDSVGKRTPIGIAGVDGGSMGSGRTALYFEIRKGTTAVDPELWLV